MVEKMVEGVRGGDDGGGRGRKSNKLELKRSNSICALAEMRAASLTTIEIHAEEKNEKNVNKPQNATTFINNNQNDITL